MRLLFVHGRAQEGKTPASLETEWMSALNVGLGEADLRLPKGLRIDVPFYGDELKKLLDKRNLPPADEVGTRGDAVPDAYKEFVREVALEAKEKNLVTSADIDAEIDDPSAERGPENWKWVQAIIRRIDRRTPGVSNVSIELLLRDVYVYVNDGPVRRKINKIVAERLTEEPTVVVGHSLGAVVAYEVLREHEGNSVARYITVGSPLGIRAIRRRLATPLTMPNGVKDWYNARDPHDVVALYPLDAENFRIDPAIRNYSEVNNSTENRHGIAGYLDDPKIAKEIQAACAA